LSPTNDIAYGDAAKKGRIPAMTSNSEATPDAAATSLPAPYENEADRTKAQANAVDLVRQAVGQAALANRRDLALRLENIASSLETGRRRRIASKASAGEQHRAELNNRGCITIVKG
jgi:hypothetical protein